MAPTADNRKGDLYGASFAVGDFDGDGFPDLAVGAPHAAAPGESTRAGIVRIYYGGQWPQANYVANCGTDRLCNTTTGGPLTRSVVLRPSAVASGLTSDDGFGTALVAGNFYHADRDDLIVGAPGMVDGRGRVFLYEKRMRHDPRRPAQSPAGLSGPTPRRRS